MSEMKAWVNKKTAKEGFTALHFGSFRGNVNMIRSLIKYQADIRALNFYGLNVMHVAAQGDQPVSLVSDCNLRSTSKRKMCPTKSEIKDTPHLYTGLVTRVQKLQLLTY